MKRTGPLCTRSVGIVIFFVILHWLMAIAMRVLMRYIVLTLCLLLSLPTFAQGWGRASLRVAEAADGTLTASFRMGRMSVSATGGRMSAVTVDGMTGGVGEIGEPDLPTACTLLLLPRGARMVLADVRGTEQSADVALDGHLVQPVPAATVKDAPPSTPVADSKTYGTDAWYRGGDPVELEHLGTMADSEVYRLTVRPVAYNPVQGTLRCYPSLEAVLATVASPLPPSVLPMPERYLIVSRPCFREGLQPFVRWKRQEGFEVVELYADTNKRDIVKALIAPYFAAAEPRWPRYVLLVGDAAQLQAFIGTTRPTGLETHVTDLYYAEHTDDYLPDALVGRWPVNDTAELAAVVRKTLRYEQGLDLDSTRLRRMLLVAGHEEQTPAPVTTNGQVNYVGLEAALAHPDLDTLCYRNPASADQRSAILADLRQGAAVLNYTAHCTVGGWSSPAVSFGSVDTLDNPQPLLWVNNCCQSNAFTGTCFGEQLLRKPSGGAIGVIGATNSTLWNEDYYWAVGPKHPFSLTPAYDSTRLGAFDCWTGRVPGVLTQGALMAAGNRAVTAFGSPYSKFYWEIYCLLGDPSLVPWFGTPRAATLTLRDSVRAGATEVLLHTEAGVRVSVMQADSLLGVAVAEADGELTVPLRSSVDTGEVVLTCTDRRQGPASAGRPFLLLPRVATLRAAQPIAAVGLFDVAGDDSTVACRVANLGSDTLFGLGIALLQDSMALATGAALTTQTVAVDTLPPQSRVAVGLHYAVTALGQLPMWQASLAAFADTQLAAVGLRQALTADYPEATFRLLDADGHEVHRLLARHTYLFEAAASGRIDSLSVRLTALPGFAPLADTTGTTVPVRIPFTAPDTLSHLHIEALLAAGNYRCTYSLYMVGGERRDGFDEGFASHPWRHTGTLPWTLEPSASGGWQARSGAIGGRQTSDLVVDVLLHQPDSVAFKVKTSSEVQYDKFQFLVDGVRRGNELWGESEWKQYAVPLAVGRHTLCWRYVKDDSGNIGDDCVRLDDVRMPLALWDSAYGWFGDGSLAVAGTPYDGMPLSVYPNPTNGTLTVVHPPAEAQVRLLDLMGREVYSTALPLPATLRLPALPDGTYMLLVVTGDNRFNHKIIIRR